jgi:hypothetical protein
MFDENILSLHREQKQTIPINFILVVNVKLITRSNKTTYTFI